MATAYREIFTFPSFDPFRSKTTRCLVTLAGQNLIPIVVFSTTVVNDIAEGRGGRIGRELG